MAFRFNTPPGIVFGDLLVTGDLTVEGSSTVEVDSTVLGDMDIQGQLIIDTDNVEAFLVRADGDGGDVFAVDTINDLVIITSSLTFGATPAATGTIRLQNVDSIVARNQNDNADLNMMSHDASANLLIGSSVSPRITFPQGPILDLPAVLSIGVNPASTGAIRLPNSSAISWRNFANNGDISMLSFSSSDVFEFGTSAVFVLNINPPRVVIGAGTLTIENSDINGLRVQDTSNIAILRVDTANEEVIASGKLTINHLPSNEGLVETSIQHVTATTGNLSGPTATLVGLIPAGALLLGITTSVLSGVGGPAGYDVGDGVDVDRWGASISTTIGTDSDITDYTSTALTYFPTATDVIITSDGVDFSGSGNIRVAVHYITLVAP